MRHSSEDEAHRPRPVARFAPRFDHGGGKRRAFIVRRTDGELSKLHSRIDNNSCFDLPVRTVQRPQSSSASIFTQCAERPER
jgi:hypothetical protein